MTQFKQPVTEPIDWVPASQPSLTPKPVTEPTGLVYRNSLPDQQRDNKGDPCYLKTWVTEKHHPTGWPVTEIVGYGENLLIPLHTGIRQFFI